MTPIEAVRKLSNLGYRFELAGDRLRYRYEGPGKPDPDTVRPLLEVVKANKPEVVNFLRCYCPNGKINDDESAGGKPISICPKCQGEIFLKTSFGKLFCYQCFCLMNVEMGIDNAGFTEVDLVLEEAIEKAEERSAILEHDGGLERKQANETARVMHIQPAIDDLLRRGLISIEGGDPGAQMAAPPLRPASRAPGTS
jgi:hypothetical protein